MVKFQRRAPGELGFDGSKFKEAMVLGESLDNGMDTDLTAMLPDGSRHPFDRPLGPVVPRGLTNGIVLRDGCIAGSYGTVEKADTTFSATKSYLNAIAGLAFDRGLIALDAKVSEQLDDADLQESQNVDITWRQLLQQTSEWEGELWGVPDWIDRGRQVSGPSAAGESTVGGSAAGTDRRDLSAPGSFWEYNDVRVNRASYALLRVFGRALPEVLQDEIMGPIGASDAWQWRGYSTSTVEVGGLPVESVSGGAHWGGGLAISSLDHARFGLLYANGGQHNGHAVLSAEWIRETTTPCALKPDYGLMWWLNHADSISAVAGANAYAARGAGGNIVFVEPDRDVVIVLRWCKSARSVIDAVLSSLA